MPVFSIIIPVYNVEKYIKECIESVINQTFTDFEAIFVDDCGQDNSSLNKRYSKDQLARILIINMMRSSMMLEKIDYILHYINGNIEDTSDDIIPESELYGYICDIYDRFGDSGCHKEEELRSLIREITAEKYVEPFEGAKERLDRALEIILVAYFASNAAALANILFNDL